MALRPDLTNAKAILDDILFGAGGSDTATTVRITRDPAGPDDDVFDTNTGEWTTVGQSVIYTGAANVRASDPERIVDVGGGDQVRSEWALKLPLSAPQPPAGAMVEILTNVRDPEQVGRRFKISRVLGGSFAVMHKAVMYEFVPIGNELP